MTRTVTFRTVVMAVVAAAISVLTSGCIGANPPKGDWYGNAVDIARAQRAWADPWAAPTDTRVAGYEDRQSGALVWAVGVRREPHPSSADMTSVFRAETLTAIASGWRLVAAQCDRNPIGRSTVALTRGATLDDLMTATVRVELGDHAGYLLTVTIEVPHHLDVSWASPPTLPLESSCLAQGAGGERSTATGYGGRWSLGDWPTVPSKPEPQWPSAVVPADLTAAVAVASADPWLTSVAATPTTPVWTGTERFNVRPLATSQRNSPAAPQSVPAQVQAATTAGWTLTYAACDPSGPLRAEVRRNAGANREIIARISRAPTANASFVTSVISTPGLTPTSPSALTSTCLTTDPTGGRSGWRADGIPGFGPTMVQPLQP